MSEACPCCGRPMERSPAAILEEVNLTPGERIVAETLAENFGKRVRKSFIVQALYEDDPDGGPLNPHNTVSVHIHRIRKKLHRAGVRIKIETSWGGPNKDSGAARMIWEEEKAK